MTTNEPANICNYLSPRAQIAEKIFWEEPVFLFVPMRGTIGVGVDLVSLRTKGFDNSLLYVYGEIGAVTYGLRF